MTTETVTLTDFLLARIAEDETMLDGSGVWSPAREYAQEEPGRWRAECEAKRRIVDYAIQRGINKISGNPNILAVLDVVLAALAEPYADHPDYRSEWSVS